MSEILIPSDNMLITEDRFIVDNMLTEEDLDFDPEFWAEMSNDSNSSDPTTTHLQTNPIIESSVCGPILMSGPETPPSSSSDRSTPPNFDDLSHNIFTTNTLPNVTILPTINICPIGPLSPIIANPTPFMTFKTQNNFNSINNNIRRSSVASNVEINECQLRREARKIRNRESASTSRKRKKEYLESLEQRINCLMKENFDLKNENQRLKTKLNDLENKNNCSAKKGPNNAFECKCRTLLTSNGSNKKAALSLLAIVFMLGLNFAPFSGVLIANDNKISGIDMNVKRDSNAKHGMSRTLLWNSNENSVDIDVIAFNSSQFKNNSNSQIDCKTYVNQTESLRLESDLRDWLSKVKLEKEEVFKYKKQLKENNKQLRNRFNKPIPLPRLKAWIQKRTETDFNEINDYPIESYKNGLKIPQINYEDLLSAIHRRDDTFYLLSYSSKDYLIIPPMNRSSSNVRPRFSLLIPLMSTLNESLIRGTNVTYSQMSVLQIDCQVVNTKMVLFNTSPNRRTIPLPDISSLNSTVPPKTKNRTSIFANKPKKRS